MRKVARFARPAHLKQLRLSGILDSREARNRQAIDSKLAYTEFLALLIEDEIARRKQKKYGTRLRRAAFRTTKMLDAFDFDQLPNLNRALVHELATGRYITECAPVLIVGAYERRLATLDRLRHNAYCLVLDGKS